MAFEKDNKKKEFVCRNCGTFLDAKDLKNNKCPNCGEEDEIYMNDLVIDNDE